MKNLLLLSVFWLFSAQLFSQATAELYSKNTQILLERYSLIGKTSPRALLERDKLLLDIFGKAKTLNNRFFKNDYQAIYNRYLQLVVKESSLVANQENRLIIYHNLFVDFKISKLKKLCINIFRGGYLKRRHYFKAKQELIEFYQEERCPILDNALVSFGQFWEKEKDWCEKNKMRWKETVYY